MNISTKLLEDELTGFCESASLSEDGLREIIEKHGAANVSNINNYAFFLEACENEGIPEGILRDLLEYFPNAARHADEEGRQSPLHYICYNKKVTPSMVQLLIDAYPDSVRQEDNDGYMPLHSLCLNKNSDGSAGLEILKLIVEKCPESVRHVTGTGVLPIHLAAINQSPEFCRLLIEAYPGSERMVADGSGALPFHLACVCNTVATAEYLYKVYPESINVADNNGSYQFITQWWVYTIETTTHQLLLKLLNFFLTVIPT